MSYAETNQAQLALKNAKNSMKRLEALEALIPQILSAMNTAVQNLEGGLRQLDETQAALVEMTGREDVETLVRDTRRRKALERIAREKEEVQVALAEGRIIKADKVTEQSIVTLKESDVPEEINQVQFAFAQLIPAMRQLVLGKVVGDKVLPQPGAHEFEIAAIYTANPNQPPVAEVPPEAIVTETPPPEAE